MELEKFFDTETSIDPLRGYPERDVEWFETHIITDFRVTAARLGLKGWLLDVGCAYGYFTRRYAQMFDEVFGVDFSERRIREAAKANAAPNVEYVCMDITSQALKMPPNAYDCAVSSAVFQHIPPDKRAQAFDNVAAALKPKAYLVLYDEDFCDRPERWDGFYEPLSPSWLQTHVRSFDITEKHFVAVGNHKERIYRYELRKT